MTAVTPNDDGEIHDLVLLFANSKIPRGSDTFQTLIDDFLKPEAEDVTDGAVASDHIDYTLKETRVVSDRMQASQQISFPRVGITPPPNTPPVSDGKTTHAPHSKPVLKPLKVKAVRMLQPESPKPLSHVHWPDERKSKLARSPGTEQLHHARLYMKTTPKPILKHDDQVLVDNGKDVHPLQKYSTPPNI